jgi:hypothetical protein
VRDALALRTEILRYLGETAPGSSTSARHPEASVESWRLLLRVECCALPLVARLRRHDAFGRLSGHVQLELVTAQGVEMQRVLAARAVIREIELLCANTDVRLSVLKGGAHAVDGRLTPLDLGDVDLLAERGQSAEAWTALVRGGWKPEISGIDPATGLGDRIHFAPVRSTGHELSVELHDRFTYGPTSVATEELIRIAIPGFTAIRRLRGTGAILATLHHSVIKHPYRRGHLRDLFLLDEAFREASEEERDAVDHAFARDPYAPELHEMMRQSLALSSNEYSTEDSTATRAFVAWKYATAEGTSRLFGMSVPGWAPLTLVSLERPPVRVALFREQLHVAFIPVPTDSPSGQLRWLRFPLFRKLGLPRLVRSSYRLLMLGALLMTAGPVRRHIRGLIR